MIPSLLLGQFSAHTFYNKVKKVVNIYLQLQTVGPLAWVQTATVDHHHHATPHFFPTVSPTRQGYPLPSTKEKSKKTSNPNRYQGTKRYQSINQQVSGGFPVFTPHLQASRFGTQPCRCRCPPRRPQASTSPAQTLHFARMYYTCYPGLLSLLSSSCRLAVSAPSSTAPTSQSSPPGPSRNSTSSCTYPTTTQNTARR